MADVGIYVNLGGYFNSSVIAEMGNVDGKLEVYFIYFS
jgi:hypothetical protein